MKRLAIDEDRCTGNGRCYALFPDWFTDDDRGYGRVTGDGALPDDALPAAQRAVVSCPEQAVALVED